VATAASFTGTCPIHLTPGGSLRTAVCKGNSDSDSNTTIIIICVAVIAVIIVALIVYFVIYKKESGGFNAGSVTMHKEPLPEAPPTMGEDAQLEDKTIQI